MRRLIAAAAAALAIAPSAFAQSAGRASSVDVSPNNAPTGQPPFGGSFESRLDRVGADIEGGVKQGWLSADQAGGLAAEVTALRTEVRTVRERNGGKLPGADNRRLQEKVTALHKEIGDLAAAARRQGREASP
jgi:hypothetical protein